MQNTNGREIEMAYVAFRVYRDKPPGPQTKFDERGTFVGWSVKFDEWIPVYSPRIAPHKSKVG